MMEELLKRATGASKVLVFDHNLHNSNATGRAPPKGESTRAPPVFSAHNDYTNVSAPLRIRDLAKENLNLAAKGGSPGTST